MESNKLNATAKDYLMMHFLVVIWGFTAILGLMVKISPLALTFYRTLLAAFGLWIVLVFTKKMGAVLSKTRWQMLGVGVLMGVHWFTFFASARASNASVCLAGMATTSVWTALIDPLMSRRPVSWLQVGLGLLVVVGLVIIFGFEYERAAVGLLLALLSALLAAFFTIFNSRFAQKHEAMLITFYEMVGGCVAAGVLWFIFETASPTNTPKWPPLTDWFWIMILAWVCTVYAYSMGTALLKKISPFTFNLIVNMEPVYGIVLAFLVFGEQEKMTPAFYGGTLVILLAVVGYPLLRK
jgi:drug/metabolite transporter (DMT)-like permease